jgi:hypothetical protein
MKNPYKTQGVNSNKEIARVRMVDAIANSGTSKGLILSLPNNNCFIEMDILQSVSHKYSFIGVENNEQTFIELQKKVMKEKLYKNITPVYGDFSSQIYNRTENTYSHIIADYCGQLFTAAPELEYAMKNNIVEVNGTISITLAKRMHSAGNSFEKSVNKGNGKRPKGITKFEFHLNNFIKKFKNYEVIDTFHYSDKKNDKKGQAMILKIVKRVA